MQHPHPCLGLSRRFALRPSPTLPAGAASPSTLCCSVDEAATSRRSGPGPLACRPACGAVTLRSPLLLRSPLRRQQQLQQQTCPLLPPSHCRGLPPSSGASSSSSSSSVTPPDGTLDASARLAAPEAAEDDSMCTTDEEEEFAVAANSAPSSSTSSASSSPGGIPHRWRIVWMMSAAFVLCNMDKVNMSVAVIPMAHDLGWSATERGLVSSSFFWGYSLTQVGLLPAVLGC